MVPTAQAYPYFYNGSWTSKQDKCRTSVPLDKPRIWLDFNELCGEGPEGEPVYLFSQGDVVNDSSGNDLILREGMEVSMFDEDLDENNQPDPILAEGILIRGALAQYPRVKWLVRLTKTVWHSGSPYVYWMSDLQ